MVLAPATPSCVIPWFFLKALDGGNRFGAVVTVDGSAVIPQQFQRLLQFGYLGSAVALACRLQACSDFLNAGYGFVRGG